MDHEPKTSTKTLIHPARLLPRLKLLVIDPKLTQSALKTHGKFQIPEVDPRTWTPISINIGTFDIPLLMHVLIKPHIKRVEIPISDTNAGIRIYYT